MPEVRQPAVAGLFYPAAAAECRTTIEQLLAAEKNLGGKPLRALIAPHAGYIYSGPMAARAYRQLESVRGVVRRVVVAGPNHRVPLRGIATVSATAFATPLGLVEVDRAAVAELVASGDVAINDAAHREEHCIEVQLPFLQATLDGFQLIPLLVGDSIPSVVAAVLRSLWRDDTLLVISSDLSHYLDYAHAQQRDRDTCRSVLAGELSISPEQACGCNAINGLLHLLREEGSFSQQRSDGKMLALLGLNNSGDTAGGRDRVVGYGAFAVA